MSHRSQCNGANFPNSQIPRNPGELSMCKQCVPSSFSLPTHKRFTPRLIIVASWYQPYWGNCEVEMIINMVKCD